MTSEPQPRQAQIRKSQDVLSTRTHYLQGGPSRLGAMHATQRAREGPQSYQFLAVWTSSKDIKCHLTNTKEPELVCEVERYQLDLVGLTSTHIMDSKPNSWRKSVISPTPELPSEGGFGDTQKHPTVCLVVVVLPDEQKHHLSVALCCKREGSCYCLCLCTN